MRKDAEVTSQRENIQTSGRRAAEYERSSNAVQQRAHLMPCRDVSEDHAEQPSMRWISTAPSSENQGPEPRGRAVLRSNPNPAMGFSYSVTDTSVPSADGSRR